MTMFRKLGAFSAAALLIVFSFSGCCGGGSLCPFGGGGCGAAAPVQAVAVDGCSSCAAQQGYVQQSYSPTTYAQPTYAQQSYAQPTYSQGFQSAAPSFSQGGVVSGGSGSVIPSAQSFGSGTSSPVFSGGSGGR